MKHEKTCIMFFLNIKIQFVFLVNRDLEEMKIGKSITCQCIKLVKH